MEEIAPQVPTQSRLRYFQLAVWPVLAVLYFGFDLGRQSDPNWRELLWRSLIWGVAGLSVSGLLAWLYRLTGVEKISALSFASIAIGGSVLGGFAWLFFFNRLDVLLALEGGWVPLSWTSDSLYFEWMDYSLMLLVWHGVLFSSVQVTRTMEQRRLTLELEKQAAEAQLIALRAQLNPHFLFNALNSAMALVHDSPERAEEVLQRLSDVLRASLTRTETHVPLQEEIALLADYLGVEKVRFEERLQVQWAIERVDTKIPIPSGLLLPLVDNAIKHGMNHTHRPMQLIIGATQRDDHIELFVSNSGHLTNATHERSLGLGLANVTQRIQAEFGDRGEFSLVEDSGCVIAKITFPWRGGEP